MRKEPFPEVKTDVAKYNAQNAIKFYINISIYSIKNRQKEIPFCL